MEYLRGANNSTGGNNTGIKLGLGVCTTCNYIFCVRRDTERGVGGKGQRSTLYESL